MYSMEELRSAGARHVLPSLAGQFPEMSGMTEEEATP
jgi:hypothetical protein